MRRKRIKGAKGMGEEGGGGIERDREGGSEVREGGGREWGEKE